MIVLRAYFTVMINFRSNIIEAAFHDKLHQHDLIQYHEMAALVVSRYNRVINSRDELKLNTAFPSGSNIGYGDEVFNKSVVIDEK